ncbi:1-phosphofructokinase [Blattamonas nauphoetae]|uniref:1-phosphofructokinase n=1 Tax=Blattamonas nauphoetae TaxID=2049346 RepID=A0ABQ9XN19_9EUKA|nr:1-phosphofructokinase [Blattamonas nauphoetae]
MSNQHPIICVSYHPCIDRTLEVEEFKTGHTNRAIFIGEQAAGKCINIAHILPLLGVKCVLYGIVGNDAKHIFEERLKQVPHHLTGLPLRTRINMTMIDKKRTSETHIREVGTPLDEKYFRDLMQEVLDAGHENQFVVLSGSLPPNIPDSCLFDFIVALKAKKMKVFVDTNGSALAAAVKANPDLIKPNREELKELIGAETFEKFGITQSADTIRFLHPEMSILLSDGANGCYFVSQGKRKHGQFQATFTVPVVSTIGAGDALLAGFLAGLYLGWDLDNSIKYAVRVATATLPCLSAGEIDPEVLNHKSLSVVIEDL